MKTTYQYKILPFNKDYCGGTSTVFYLQELKKLWGFIPVRKKYPLTYIYESPSRNGSYEFRDGSQKVAYPFVNYDEGKYYAHKLLSFYNSIRTNHRLVLDKDVFIEDTPDWSSAIPESKKLLNTIKESVLRLDFATEHIDIKNALYKLRSDVTQLGMWYNF